MFVPYFKLRISITVLRAHSHLCEFMLIIVQVLILFVAADCSDRLHLVLHTRLCSVERKRKTTSSCCVNKILTGTQQSTQHVVSTCSS